MNIYTVIGLTGFAGYVISYALLQLGLLDGNGIPYTLVNVAAASMVLVSMLEQFNLASALIQVSWISFGLIGLGLRLLRRSPTPESNQIELTNEVDRLRQLVSAGPPATNGSVPLNL